MQPFAHIASKGDEVRGAENVVLFIEADEVHFLVPGSKFHVPS
jgi:hypothetical protein